MTAQDYGPGLPPKSLGLPGNPWSGMRSAETERDDPPPGGAGLKSDSFSLGNGVHCFHVSALQSGYMVRRVIGTLAFTQKRQFIGKRMSKQERPESSMVSVTGTPARAQQSGSAAFPQVGGITRALTPSGPC